MKTPNKNTTKRTQIGRLNKTMARPCRRGSILVVSMLIMFMILSVALAISAVTVRERITALTTDYSVAAMQMADAGVEKAMSCLNGIQSHQLNKLDSTKCPGVSLNPNCSGFSTGDYTVTFLDKNGVPNTDCACFADCIFDIKSVGKSHQTYRAIQAPYSIYEEKVGYNTPGLQGYWKLNGEITGTAINPTTTIVDSSANGYNGSISNVSGAMKYTDGKIQSSIYFGGSDGVINMINTNPGCTDPPCAANPSYTQFTLMGWFRTTATKGTIAAINAGDFFGTTGCGSGIGIDNGNVVGNIADNPGGTNLPALATVDSGALACHSTTACTDGNWHLAALTYDGANAILYVDGMQKASTPIIQTMTGLTTRLTIGTGTGCHWQYFTGSIDEVALFNRVLSDKEIYSIYNKGK